MRDAYALTLFVLIVALSRLVAALGRQTALAFFVSGNKKLILRHAAPGSWRFRARLLKPRFPVQRGIRRFGARFLRWALANPPDALALYCWGYADREIFGFDLSELGAPVFRLETGLLGYGAAQGGDVISYMVDSTAPYFDGSRPTDLERRLNAYRAGAWRDSASSRSFVDWARLSRFQKYAKASGRLNRRLTPEDTVVVGQVTGDMALQATPKAASGNVDLVVKAAAELGLRGRVFYKAHPFNTANEAEIAEIRRRAPQVELIDASISFAEIAHAGPTVAVTTSGAGLEAALRGCRVVCYGAAFYAGWGATEDRVDIPRRVNQLTIEDIFYVTMHDYARYFERATLKTLSAAQLVDRYPLSPALRRESALETARATVGQIAATPALARTEFVDDDFAQVPPIAASRDGS